MMSNLDLDFKCDVEGIKRVDFYYKHKIEDFFTPICITKVRRFLHFLFIKKSYFPLNRLFTSSFNFGCFYNSITRLNFSKCSLKIENKLFSITKIFDEEIVNCVSVEDLINFLTRKIKLLLAKEYRDGSFGDEFICRFTINLYGIIYKE